MAAEQEAQERAAQRAAGKDRRAELWSMRQQEDYEDADDGSGSVGGDSWEDGGWG